MEPKNWEPWNALGDMSPDEAKEKYVAELQKMLGKVAETAHVVE